MTHFQRTDADIRAEFGGMRRFPLVSGNLHRCEPGKFSGKSRLPPPKDRRCSAEKPLPAAHNSEKSHVPAFSIQCRNYSPHLRFD
jgi:hypothetical protein